MERHHGTRRVPSSPVALALAGIIAALGAEAVASASDGRDERLALEQKLVALTARPGGLTADEVAQRAESSSLDLVLRRAEINAAAALVDQAMAAFFPRLNLLGSYKRLSPVTLPSFTGGGALVGTQPMTNIMVNGVQILNPCSAAVQSNCDPLTPVQLTFPVLLNQTVFQASLSVPLSDYVLRSVQGLAAAAASRRAALVAERATRLKLRADARALYYNWARARLQEVVTVQALADARGHLVDARHLLDAGMASPADVMRVESQVASAELLVERARNMTRVLADQVGIAMHDPDPPAYEIGEDLHAALADLPNVDADPAPLVAEATRSRLELRVLDENRNAIHEQAKVVRAGQYPTLTAFGDAAYANPNPRIIPQTDRFDLTWDVGVALNWSPNDLAIARASGRGIDAQVAQIEAQERQLADGLRAEVTQAWSAMREARVEQDASARGLAASEESYRVRRELWRVGRATAIELTDAEQDLTQARLAAVNAGIDLRVASVRLLHAVGRDAVER